jgi:hypothetical protein
MSPKYGSRQRITKMPYNHEMYPYMQSLMEYAMHKFILPQTNDSQPPSEDESKVDAMNRLAAVDPIEYKYVPVLE